jgi:hypothetical protein
MARNRKPLLSQNDLSAIVLRELRTRKECQSIKSATVWRRDESQGDGTWRIATIPNRSDLNTCCAFDVRDVEERLGRQYDLGPYD